MTDAKQPLFTIITVCYNALPALQKTYVAIAEQTCRDYEHIIIDGASKDGTPNWLAQAQDNHMRYLSAPDKGLYDAMNKGLAMATGQYVWFVNAGDVPYDKGTLAGLAAIARADADILYGEVMMVDQAGREVGTRSELTPHRLPDDLQWKHLRYGMVVSHQGFLPRCELAPDYITDNLCADIDWVIRCLKAARHAVRSPDILAKFEMGGISTIHRRRSHRDRFSVMVKHFGWWGTVVAHVWIIVRATIRRLVVAKGRRY